MTASGRMLSRIARVTARCQASDYLAPARLRAVEPGRLARRGTQEGVEAFASQPPMVSERRQLSLLLQEGRFCRASV